MDITSQDQRKRDTKCLLHKGKLSARSTGGFASILLISLLLGGCSSVTLNEGATLAKAGRAAATQMEQNAIISSDTMQELRKAVAFNDAYNNSQGNSASQAFLKNVSDVQSRLSSYAKVLESLNYSYSALGDLSSYGSAGNFNTSVASLVTDSNSFLQTVGSQAQVPQEVEAGVGQGGSIILNVAEAHEVKDASKAIEIVLQTIIPVLADAGTKKLMLLNKEQINGQISQAAQVLYDEGLYSYSPLLDDLGSPLSLKSTNQADAIVAKSDRLKAGLRNVMLELADEQASSMADSYDKSLAVLRTLVPLHESLQSDVPLNLSAVNAVTTQLRTVATALQSSKGK